MENKRRTQYYIELRYLVSKSRKCIFKTYTFKDNVEDPFGTGSNQYYMLFYVKSKEWNSANHIHLLTIVRKLIMADAKKFMGSSWQNDNYNSIEDDET